MAHIYKLTSLFFSASVVLVMSGCGGGAGPDERPARVAVSGTVLLEGKAVEGATVTFRSVSKGPGAIGKTDATGRFVLSTYESGDGAVPGKYNVGVSKIVDEEEEGTLDDNDENYEPPAYDQAEEEDEEDGPPRRGKGPKNEIPNAFLDPEESGLTANITEATDSLEFRLE